MSFPHATPDQSTVAGRAQHVTNTLHQLDAVLPLGECNGRFAASLSNAIALLGKPIEQYTVAELLALAEQHQARWLESEHHHQLEQQHRLDTGSLEYTQ